MTVSVAAAAAAMWHIVLHETTSIEQNRLYWWFQNYVMLILLFIVMYFDDREQAIVLIPSSRLINFQFSTHQNVIYKWCQAGSLRFAFGRGASTIFTVVFVDFAFVTIGSSFFPSFFLSLRQKLSAITIFNLTDSIKSNRIESIQLHGMCKYLIDRQSASIVMCKNIKLFVAIPFCNRIKQPSPCCACDCQWNLHK